MSSVKEAWLSYIAIALMPIGWLGMLYLYPLASGQESLVRWQEITISNKNAMFFMLPLLFVVIGTAYQKRQKTKTGKAIAFVLTWTAVLGSAYLKSITNPLGVTP